MSGRERSTSTKIPASISAFDNQSYRESHSGCPLLDLQYPGWLLGMSRQAPRKGGPDLASWAPETGHFSHGKGQ